MPQRWDVPDEWEPVHSSAFLQLLGRLYLDRSASQPTFQARVDPQHSNTFGRAHGGLIAALVDVAAGRGLRLLLQDGRAFQTVSMTVDYTSGAAVGDWISIAVELDHLSRRTAFVTCRVTSHHVLVARSSVILNAIQDGSNNRP